MLRTTPGEIGIGLFGMRPRLGLLTTAIGDYEIALASPSDAAAVLGLRDRLARWLLPHLHPNPRVGLQSALDRLVCAFGGPTRQHPAPEVRVPFADAGLRASAGNRSPGCSLPSAWWPELGRGRSPCRECRGCCRPSARWPGPW